MTRRFLPALLAVALFSLTAGCGLTGEDETSGVVTLTGQVLNTATNNPVPQAALRVLPYDLLFEADEEGRFSFPVEIDSTMELRVVASKDGFGSTSTDVLALAGRSITVPTLRIQQMGAGELVSGPGSNILLLGQSTQSIGVKESGSQEVAQLTFQVADSLGRPVVLDHSAEVRFSFGVRPNGGEFLYPATASTDNNGQVTVNLSSGTRSGVVQVVAEATIGGRALRSQPVAVAIHGGLPDQAHFTVGPDKFNFPGLRRFGLTNPVSIVVGDRYGNPVKENTAVYFTTDGGVIEGSVLTNRQGRGSVNLISANPMPEDGVAMITAHTADDNQNTVVDQTAVVFTGVPVVTVTPSVPQLGQTYHVTVTDPNGNPLAQGTTLSVRVGGTMVKAVGHTAVQFDDTAFIGGFGYEHIARGPGITEFTFRAVEDRELDEDGTPTVETITINVSGPNGALEIVLSADGFAKTASKTAGTTTDVEKLPGGGLRVRLVE